MKENKKLVNFKEKTYTVYDPGQLKYYEYEKSRNGVVYSGVGLFDQLNPDLPKIPYNGYRSYLRDNYGLTDLEYYIVVVLGGDESLLPECTYKNPYTGEKCTEKRKFRSLIPTKLRPNIFCDGCEKHTINAAAQNSQKIAYQKGITGLQKANRRSPVWREKLRIHALKQMKEGNSIFSPQEIRNPSIKEPKYQQISTYNDIRKKLGINEDYIQNSIEELIEVDKEMYLNKGKLESTCYLYLAILSNDYIKIGISTDIFRRSMRKYHGYDYQYTETLFCGNKIQAAELEYQVKMKFKEHICIGNEGFPSSLKEEIKLFVTDSIKMFSD